MKQYDIRNLPEFKEQNWKQIDANIAETDYIFPEGYWISDRGVIISYRANKEGSVLKFIIENNTYKVSLIIQSDIHITRAVHRLVLKAFGPYNPDTKNLMALIINGDPKDIRIDNLKWVTKSDFSYIEYTRNNKARYERAEKAAQLLATEKYSVREVAKMTGSSESSISNLKNGNVWTEFYIKYDLAHKNIPRKTKTFKKKDNRYKRVEKAVQLLATEKYSVSEVAKMTGFSKYTISDLKNGNTWIEFYIKYDLAHKNIPKKTNKTFKKKNVEEI